MSAHGQDHGAHQAHAAVPDSATEGGIAVEADPAVEHQPKPAAAHGVHKGAPKKGAAPEAGGEHGDAHGGGHGGSHGGHKAHKPHDADHGPGTPPWLISFGDMMTLFLCFFIMLVTMAKTQDAGLMANGLGPFIASLQMRGLDGALTESRVLDSINNYRRRFGLEPLRAEEMATQTGPYYDTVEVQDLVRSSLRNSYSLDQPLVATFDVDSDFLSEDVRHYLDLLSSSLRPGQGQVLVLDGHANDAGDRFNGDNALLALRRATAVSDYFVKELAFVSVRVEPRAWPREERRPGASARGVDAHLIQPIETEE